MRTGARGGRQACEELVVEQLGFKSFEHYNNVCSVFKGRFTSVFAQDF